jgi:two-component system, sensor histidine kinase and response regulator
MCVQAGISGCRPGTVKNGSRRGFAGTLSAEQRPGEKLVETVRVLVVDDEPGIRAGVERVLRKMSVGVPEVEQEIQFSVSEAETGEEALAIIDSAPPQILLLDNKLPGISGMEVLEQVAPRNLDMLIIIITAYASIETAVRATKQGAYDFLPKPFTPADLRNTIQKTTRHFIISRQARQLAAEKRKVRFQFISVLAHELKAPINAIEGYLNILRDRDALPDEQTYADFINRCCTRTEYMRKMINDLLDMTRIESGERKRDIAKCDVAEVARTALETVKPEADTRDIALNLDVPAPVEIMADRAELEIILNNLVSNAVKYNRDGGSVDVRVKRENETVVISVSDTGIGMTEAESAKLFNDFVRIKNAKTKKILGSGLGLSTVKKLAAMYHGDIRLESEPDRGSTFTVEIRDAQAPEAGAGAAAEEGTAAGAPPSKT